VGEFTIDNGVGGARVAPSGGGTLPFSRSELNETKQVLVQFTMATDSPLARLELSQAITEALRGVRVNGHAIVPIITDKSVEMRACDIQVLASHVTATVARTLGISLS